MASHVVTLYVDGFALVGLGGLLEGVLFELLQVSIFEAGFVAAPSLRPGCCQSSTPESIEWNARFRSGIRAIGAVYVFLAAKTYRERHNNT
uniref:hypothetical protein n=1 Tax=Haloprofundus sp. MHR1 TaxID=2572921 RepID=UPI001F16EEED|nr:hypothetical protein [Haloprofundus sp. MHR1]